MIPSSTSLAGGTTSAPLPNLNRIATIIAHYHLPRHVIADSDRRKCAAEIMEYINNVILRNLIDDGK